MGKSDGLVIRLCRLERAGAIDCYQLNDLCHAYNRATRNASRMARLQETIERLEGRSSVKS